MAVELVNGVRLRYEVVGSGDPLVMVHGSWGDHHNWDGLAPLFSDRFQVITYDRRGHSESQTPPGQGSVTDDVADLAALAEHLEHGPVHVIGNSFGGSIALRFAAEHPNLVRTLSVHEPPLIRLLADDPAAQAVLSGFDERIGAVVAMLQAGENTKAAEQFVEQVAMGPGQWELLPPPVQQTFIRNAGTFFDEANDAEALTVDVGNLLNYRGAALLTQGDASPPFFAMILDRLAPALVGAQRVTVHGAGHVPQMSHPKDYAEIIKEFIGG